MAKAASAGLTSKAKAKLRHFEIRCARLNACLTDCEQVRRRRRHWPKERKRKREGERERESNSEAAACSACGGITKASEGGRGVEKDGSNGEEVVGGKRTG